MQQSIQYNDNIQAMIGDSGVTDIAERYRIEAKRLAAESQDRWDCERILNAAREGVTRSQVLRIVRRSASEIDGLLGKMLKDGAISVNVEYGNGKGRPLTVYWVRGKKEKKGRTLGERSPSSSLTQGKEEK